MAIHICNLLFKASLEEKQMKNKRKKDGLQGIFFSISDSCLYLVSMQTNQCFFAYLTYSIIMAWNPDKITLGKLYSHVAGVRNLNSQLRVAMRSPL